MADPTTDDQSAPVSASKGSKLLAIIVAAVLAAGAAGGGAYWFATKGEAATATDEKGEKSDKGKKDKASQGPAIYVEFDPPFVVNFEARGMTRFLQVTVQALTRDPLTADMIKQHDPVIRNDLLMLLSNQTYETISSREGKEKLRTEALQVVANVIENEGGSGESVEQLYFTSFVMQ
jgi:flagellar protein FliL